MNIELALTDKDMQVWFGLKTVLESWDREFLVTKTIFQNSSNIGWPQQPPTERISVKNLIFVFDDPFHNKGTSIDRFCARDDPTISDQEGFFGERCHFIEKWLLQPKISYLRIPELSSNQI